MINEALSGVLDQSAAFKALSDSFREFERSVKKEETESGHSIQSIENDISELISDWDASFKLKINTIGMDDIVKNLVDHEVVDQGLGIAQPIGRYGQGFQRSMIYTLCCRMHDYKPGGRI